MTNKFNIDNRELLQRISCGEAVVGIDFGNLIVRELAAFRLSAMDSEPVAWLAIYHGEVYDEAIGITRSVVEAQADHFGWESALTEIIPLYRHAQQPVVPDYLETLPCPVLLEPGIRFGKGVKTRLVLDAIKRRAEHYAELEAMTPEERAEYAANIEAFKAMLPQPAPVVPDDVLEALQKVARIRLDLDEFDGDRRGIADCLCDAEEALIEVVNRRAAMLAAASQEVK